MKPTSPSINSLAPLLAIGAHPDDIEFGCGGIVAMETMAGRPAHFIVCSHGEAGTHGTPAERVAEAEQAATALRSSLQFIEFDGDAHLSIKAEHAISLARIVRQRRPAIVLAPTVVENQHPDHWRLGTLVRDAVRLARYGGLAELRDLPSHAIDQLLFYAISPEAEPRDISPLLVDISEPEVIAAWTTAMQSHASQMRTRPYAELCLMRARVNGLRAGVEYAIALFPNDPIVVDSLSQLRRALANSNMSEPRTLRIGITCYPSVGGSGILASALGEELACRGHEIHFISSGRPFRPPAKSPRIHFHPVSINDYDLFKYPDYTLPLSVKMAEVTRECRLDILHVHYAVPHATAAILAKSMLPVELQPKVVTTLHGTDTTLLGRDPAYRPAIGHALSCSDAVTAVSVFLQRETRELLSFDRPIEVIHNFFTPRAPTRSREDVRRELGLGDEALIIHSSNLRPLKRIDLLLNALSRVRSRASFKLLLLAGGSFEPYAPLAERLGLSSRLMVLENVQQVEDYLQAADLCLVTSDSESFCLSILEAMCFECPSVATRVGGIPEVIRDNETGVLVPAGDAESIARAVEGLLDDPGRRAALGAAARQDAARRFSTEAVVSQYEEVYRRLV